MKPLLDVTDLRVEFSTYGGTVSAVRGVSFKLFPSETLAIVGESGSGKSVTCQALMGLVPCPPGRIVGGSVIFEGTDLLKATPERMESMRGSRIGMIFQDPLTSLNPTMKVGHQIAEVLVKHQDLSMGQALKESRSLMELVQIPEAKKRLGQYPHEFSGGMRQRVMIAIALACRPKVLIADEPTTALDVTIQGQMLALLRDLQKDIGMSVILITHDLGVVASVADRVAVMYAGEVVETGTVDDIFYKPRHPYTVGLRRAIPNPADPSGERLEAIEGSPPDLFSPPDGCSFHKRCAHAMQVCESFPPPLTSQSDGQTSASCWLQHDAAPSKVKKDFQGRGGHLDGGEV